MPYLKTKPATDRPGSLPHCLLGLFEDLVCPWYECNIITPSMCVVLPGWGRCPRCHYRFRVVRRTAEAANRRAGDLRPAGRRNRPDVYYIEELTAVRRHGDAVGN